MFPEETHAKIVKQIDETVGVLREEPADALTPAALPDELLTQAREWIACATGQTLGWSNQPSKPIQLVQDLEAQLTAQASRLQALEQRASTLEDATFHFLTCRTCKKEGADACESGKLFEAFIRGELDAY